jgi:thiazole synthase ThiGH ThiG subunit
MADLFRTFRSYECPDCKKVTYIGRILDTELPWCPSCGSNKGLVHKENLYIPEDTIEVEQVVDVEE